MKKFLTVFAVLALVLAVSGTAFAAKGLLTGAGIKDGTLTGADVRAHSLGAGLFSASTRASLKGVSGRVGTAGLNGLNGSAGARH